MQFLSKNTIVINNLEDLYKINFNKYENIIIKINCVDNSIRNIFFSHILCTKEFDKEDLLLLNQLDYECLYFYKQNEFVNKVHSNRIFYYGIDDADITLTDYKLLNGKTSFSYIFKNQQYRFSTTLLGLYNVYHILLAILLMSNLKIGIKNKIGTLKNLEHNLNVKELNGFTMIDDTYHTNLESFIEGLNILSDLKGTKVLVTPGLIGYNTILSNNISMICDYVILIGERSSKTLYDSLIKNKFDKKKIFITNDTYESYAMISNLNIKGNIYALYENKLSNLYKD